MTKPHGSSSVAATYAWSSLMSSARAHSVPRETIMWVPELELEWGRVERNFLLNKEFVAPGRIFIVLYTVNNKWGSLIRIIESIRLEKNFKIIEPKIHASKNSPRLKRLLKSWMPINLEALEAPGLRPCQNWAVGGDFFLPWDTEWGQNTWPHVRAGSSSTT